MTSTLAPPTLTPSSLMRTPSCPPRTGALGHPHVAVQAASSTPPPSMTWLVFPRHYKYPLRPLQQGENWYPEIQSYEERFLNLPHSRARNRKNLHPHPPRPLAPVKAKMTVFPLVESWQFSQLILQVRISIEHIAIVQMPGVVEAEVVIEGNTDGTREVQTRSFIRDVPWDNTTWNGRLMWASTTAARRTTSNSGEWSRAISPMDDTHGNSLPMKRSFGMVKHLPINSPAYDASKEDNDPLTNDAASSVSTSRTSPSSFSMALADLVGSVKGGGPEVISWDRWICWDRSQQYYNICK
ncbi:hypothetical protein JB92DRAFT_2837194 [Gautieria morchelliformis]|nr:hypothetical protein JB92DRAFT_2837194 [Gautieria morchelliformis]